jgi:hypothetical protein
LERGRLSRPTGGPAEVRGGVKVNAPHVWRRSSRSDANGNCVEAARLANVRNALRDCKNPHGPALPFSVAEWDVLIGGVMDSDSDRG